MTKQLARFLRWCARRYIARTKPYLIGITGSVGKTTCRMIVAQTLQKMLPELIIATSSKNFNSQFGLPLAVLGIEKFSTTILTVIIVCLQAFFKAVAGGKRADVVVLEYGIDAPGDMDWLVSIAAPHTAIFTSLDLVHAHQLENAAGILQEKSKLLINAKELILVSHHMKEQLSSHIGGVSKDVLTYATRKEDTDEADIGWKNRALAMGDNELPVARFEVLQGNEELLTIATNLLPQEDAGYISMSMELAMIVSRRLDTLLMRLDQEVFLDYVLQPGRFSVYPGRWGSVLVDSSYNGAPQSMRVTINNVTELRTQIYPTLELIYCLGDMRELGDWTETEHRKLAREVAQSAEGLYLVGQSMRQFFMPELEAVGYNMNRVQWFPTSRALGEKLAADLPQRQHRAVILFKGSQNTIFLEEAIKPILKDPDLRAGLARQSGWRMKKKEAFFDVSH